MFLTICKLECEPALKRIGVDIARGIQGLVEQGWIDCARLIILLSTDGGVPKTVRGIGNDFGRQGAIRDNMGNISGEKLFFSLRCRVR